MLGYLAPTEDEDRAVTNIEEGVRREGMEEE
jgi:hypothetical protein